jgi:hypothetical protein
VGKWSILELAWFHFLFGLLAIWANSTVTVGFVFPLRLYFTAKLNQSGTDKSPVFGFLCSPSIKVLFTAAGGGSAGGALSAAHTAGFCPRPGDMVGPNGLACRHAK